MLSVSHTQSEAVIDIYLDNYENLRITSIRKTSYLKEL
jgi:hypothetical protein